MSDLQRMADAIARKPTNTSGELDHEPADASPIEDDDPSLFEQGTARQITEMDPYPDDDDADDDQYDDDDDDDDDSDDDQDDDDEDYDIQDDVRPAESHDFGEGIPVTQPDVVQQAPRKPRRPINYHFNGGVDGLFDAVSAFEPKFTPDGNHHHSLLIDEMVPGSRNVKRAWKSVYRATWPVTATALMEALEPGSYRVSVRDDKGKFVVSHKPFTIGDQMGMRSNPVPQYDYYQPPPPPQAPPPDDSRVERAFDKMFDRLAAFEERLARMESNRATPVRENPTQDPLLQQLVTSQTSLNQRMADMQQESLQKYYQLQLDLERKLSETAAGIMKTKDINNPLDTMKSMLEIFATLSGKVASGDIEPTGWIGKASELWENFGPVITAFVSKATGMQIPVPAPRDDSAMEDDDVQLPDYDPTMNIPPVAPVHTQYNPEPEEYDDDDDAPEPKRKGKAA